MSIRTHIIKSSLLLSSVFMLGQIAEAVTVDVGGSIRPRVEYASKGIQGNTPTAANPNPSKTHTTMQTRLNVKGTVDENVSAFIQIQDARTWGGETPGVSPSFTRTGTSNASTGLDVHQAYLLVKNVWGSNLALKVGRQEMVFDEARLIGNIGWIQQAQSFDAIRADFNAAGLGFTTFYSQTLANDTHPTMGPTIVAGTRDGHFGGARITYKIGEGKNDRITGYYYICNNTSTGGNDVYDNLNILGIYFNKQLGKVRVRLDGAYEFGDRSAVAGPALNVDAYMLTGAIEMKHGAGHGGKIGLWVDYLSGDSNGADRDQNQFVTPYATNHKFYGHIDKFLNNPVTGLIDLAVKGSIGITPSTKVQAHFHNFSAASTRTGVASNYGQEIDLQITHKLAANTALRAGYSHYFAGGSSPAGNVGVGGILSLESDWAWMMFVTKF